jgi:CRP/FNR family transcriptional regulator, anaerobic regulatory protein
MDKILKIKNSIDSIVSLSEKELLIFCNAFDTLKPQEKNDFFLKEGQVCDYIGLSYIWSFNIY